MNKFNELTKDEKKKITVYLLLSLLLIILVAEYAIPRTEMQIKTLYTQKQAGIVVLCKLENKGTLKITDIHIEVVLRNENKERVQTHEENISKILTRDAHKTDPLIYGGSQYDTYYVYIHLTFKDGHGKRKRVTFDHEAKDYMNLNFKDKYSSWG